ncbi:MAG: TIGR03936 family radical SAM-associated protein [Candidatus Omnitrophica bacterium]|nr:TIGR03936 family radical SAM-associated protein [Candidatus Omnitrophota bacterium]
MKFIIEFKFCKCKKMRFISHLDLMRLFMRALRRAMIPVMITQGFNPHPKLSLKRALKLGIESDNEIGQVILKEPLSAEEFIRRINAVLPDGVRVISARIC